MRPVLTQVGEPTKVQVTPAQAEVLRAFSQESPSGWTFSGPGVLTVAGRLLVILPRGHRPPQDPLGDTLRFLQSLLEYRRDLHRRSVVDEEARLLDTWGAAESRLDSVEAALLLWRDFNQQGPIVFNERRHAVDEPGRVHWPRTLRIGRPLDGRGGSQLLHVVTERVQRRPHHPLTQLHRATVEVIGRQLGTGGASQAPIPPQEALSVLDRWESGLFADRHRQIARWLRRVHSGDSGGVQHKSEDAGLRLLVAPRFAKVWERMLQVALGHQAAAGALRGRYALPDGDTKAGLRLIPDIVVARPGGRLLVLDAKEYASTSLPGTPDLGKQLLYRLAFSDLLHPQGRPLEAIGNAFLFPGAANPVASRCVHQLDPPASAALGRIVGLDVDLVRVMDAWNAGRVDVGLVGALDRAIFSAGLERS